MFNVARNSANPLIKSDNEHPWRALAAFNPSPVRTENEIHLVYRAMTDPMTYNGKKLELSSIGIASTTDFSCRTFNSNRQLIEPTEDWELFGCEDPRVTKIDDTYYIFYTAISDYPFKPEGIRCAVALTKDLKTIEQKHLVTPFNAKAMVLFPEKVNGKYTVMLTANSDLPPSKMSIAQFDTIEDLWNEEKWREWYKNVDSHTIDLRREETDHAEVGAPPIKTKDGWLVIYSHIQNYFDEDKRIFGIEAVLLDLENPRKIIGRTNYPFMVPEESYEQYGMLENIVFPSGATVEEDTLAVYYGGCDTVCCNATLSLSALIENMKANDDSVYVKRSKNNPILLAKPDSDWEGKYVFNPTAIELEDRIHILYRAMGTDNTSVIGYANTRDGVTIDERLDEPIYVPREPFESKLKQPDGLSGCEDARIVEIDKRLYVTYTAYDGVNVPRVAVSSIATKDFLARQWNWNTPQLISPEGIDDKDAAIFPEKIHDKYMILHRIDHHVCADFTDSLDFSSEKLNRCILIFGPRKGMWDGEKVGIAGPPFKTEDGWVLFYHGINTKNHYQLGAALLSKDDPTVVIGRSAMPIMEPTEIWEREGWIPNVVFPCGQVVRDDEVYIYYGGADQVVSVATLSLKKLLRQLK